MINVAMVVQKNSRKIVEVNWAVNVITIISLCIMTCRKFFIDTFPLNVETSLVMLKLVNLFYCKKYIYIYIYIYFFNVLYEFIICSCLVYASWLKFLCLYV